MEISKEPARDAIVVQDWGMIEYREAMQRQMDLVDLVSYEHARETIVFCSHPPVVTLGRGTQPGDVFGWRGDTIEVNRGGRATYHGPSQIVAYPILDLNKRGRDLHRYMRLLENAIVATLSDCGITASGRSVMSDGAPEATEATGVWLGQKKLASIGIGVRKWIAFHGLALNVDLDPMAFSGMKPCGFSAETMVSMEEVLGKPVNRAAVRAALEGHLLRELTVESFLNR